MYSEDSGSVDSLPCSSSSPPSLPSFGVPFQEGPVGARLQTFWQNWETIGAEPWVINVLRGGYYLPLQEDPPLTSSPPEMSYSNSHPLFQELQSQILLLLNKQAIEPVTDHSPGFYSRLFLAPKKSGDWRPVIDLSALNRHIQCRLPSSKWRQSNPS